jgi:hypothetical protein
MVEICLNFQMLKPFKGIGCILNRDTISKVLVLVVLVVFTPDHGRLTYIVFTKAQFSHRILEFLMFATLKYI